MGRELAYCELVIVRYGQQEHTGQDGSLTERGREQARRVGSVLALTPTDRLVSSTLKRSVQTAGEFGVDLQQVTDLCEFRFGPTWNWQKADNREDLALWRPEHHDEDESLGKFHRRVVSALDHLLTTPPDGRIVLCVHSGVIDVTLRWAFNLSPDDLWMTEAAVPHCSITNLTHWPHGRHASGAPRHTVLDAVGDTRHLPADLITD